MKKTLLTLALITAAVPAFAQNNSTGQLADRAVERRAVEAAIWGMPVVNYDLMLQEMLTQTQGKVNRVIYWGQPLDWHNQTLTPNPDTIYMMVFTNTKDVGPVVIDIPPANDGSLNGNIVNVWQMALEDAGLTGADKGKGGKYLILPPDYAEPIPEGYIPLQSDTFGGYALLRSNLKSHSATDVEKSIAYGKQVKVYPLSQAKHPPATIFTDVKNVVFDSTIRYDASFFDGLNRVVQTEPWLQRDKIMIGHLKTIGIEKGKPFTPDEKTKNLLKSAILEVKDLLEAKYDAGFSPFWEGSRWTVPAIPELVKEAQNSYNDPNTYPTDERGLAYTYAFVGLKHMGTGQMYLISIHDRDGAAFEGGKTYKLTVPPDAPVEQYWSLTAYDRETHALIKNVKRASRASNSAEVEKNTDGSVDLYLGPKAPEGKEANWIPTDPARKFEVMFRLYGPEKVFFDKAWKLPDIEIVPTSKTK